MTLNAPDKEPRLRRNGGPSSLSLKVLAEPPIKDGWEIRTDCDEHPVNGTAG